MGIVLGTYDDVCDLLGVKRPSVAETVAARGFGWAEVRGADGDLKDLVAFENKVTSQGDYYYGERAGGISSPPGQVTGMKLGTGTTAASKSGAGAAIVTYVTSLTASKAIDATWPTSTHLSSDAGCQIQWKTTWNAGEATSGTNWGEVAIVTESALADDASDAAHTIARALLSPTVPKGSTDILAVTWNHVLLGA